MHKAPIALFVYKRPQHTEKTLESLSCCEGANESELYIFCDGPGKAKDIESVSEVRKIVKKRKWCSEVSIIERDKNMGLANSIIQGVTDLCNKYGRVIVIEDDLLTSRYFLEYMNRALGLYENYERVMQISGHMFPVNIKPETDAFFLPFTTSWGWATWQRAWGRFDKDMKGYATLKGDRSLMQRFDLDGTYPYFKMLKAQFEGLVDSWAIRWYLSVFILDGLTLFPAQSLVQNIGFGRSGTHGIFQHKELSGSHNDFHVVTFAQEIELSGQSFCEIKSFLRENGKFSYLLKSAFLGLIEKYC